MSTPPFIEHAEHAETEAAKAAESQDGASNVPMVFDEDERMMVPALSFAQGKLKLPQLRRVINYSAEQPRFAIELDDGRKLPVGGTSKLRNPTTITDLIADATNEYPPAFTAAKFRPIANALRALAELEDHGASPSDETRAWIPKYCSERLTKVLDLDTDDGRIAAQGSHAMIETSEGDLCVYAPDLLAWVKLHRLAQITLPDLTERLEAIGFINRRITAPREDGPDGKRRQPQRAYWQAPRDLDWRRTR